MARDLASVRGGYKAQLNGATFEEEIIASNEWYALRKRGCVFRVPPPTAGFGSTLRYIGKGPPDFVGVLDESGVAFDTKSSTMKATYLHNPQTYIQLDRLLEFRNGGGLGFLLVKCPTMKIIWMIHMDQDLRDARDGRRVPLRDADRQKVVTHHQPYLREGTLLDMARGTAPRWDYALLLDHYGVAGGACVNMSPPKGQ